MSSRLPFESAVATGRGDDGTTGLLYGGDRISKDDPRTEAYGTVDETVVALGLVRAELGLKDQYGILGSWQSELRDLILRLQRELFIVAAELATNPEAWDRLEDGRTRVSAAMLEALDADLRATEARVTMPREFVVPGETRLSALLEQARTITRRAERRIVTLQRQGSLPPGRVLPYLNRLADLLWILARAAEQAEARPPTPARTSRPSRASRATSEEASS
jgi:cob(I)alamin adenosyltransferase